MRKWILIAVGALALVVGVVVGFRLHGQAETYAEATRLEQIGETAAAYKLYEQLGGYADARERLEQLVAAEPVLPYRAANKGDYVTFGSWEQDGNVEAGAEPIEWIVLDRVDDRLLLLSVSCLDGRPYNPQPFEGVTWETSELRAWLNGDFLQTAFTDAERTLIPEVTNVNEDRIGASDEDDPMTQVFADGGKGTEEMGVGGNDTQDRVFLLSETDTLIYLNNDVARATTGITQLVPAAESRGVPADKSGSVSWWLRSPGVYSFTAQYVEATGEPYPSGAYVELVYGVRPALWITVQGDGAAAAEEAK